MGGRLIFFQQAPAGSKVDLDMAEEDSFEMALLPALPSSHENLDTEETMQEGEVT